MNKTLITLTAFVALSYSALATDIWVSPKGSNSNPGTKDQPLKSIDLAIRKARDLRRLNDSTATNGIRIYLMGGNYNLETPVQIRPEDAGTALCPTWIEAAAGEKPVISGGVGIKGWKRAGNIPGLPKAAQGKVWEANAPEIGGRPLEFRQMWVNGTKASRASDYNEGKTKLQRILSVDKANQILWIPKPAFGTLKDVAQMEFFIHQWWAIATLRVKSVEVVGDSAKVTFCQPESQVEFEHPWPAPFIDEKKNQNGNSAFFFMNAIQLLDQPGEWFEDVRTNKVYYWPRTGENLATAEVIAPALETLLHVEGPLDNPVQYLHFKGIDFKYTSWMRPAKAGHVPLQAGFYLEEAYKLKVPGTPDKAGLENQGWLGRQSSAVSISNASHLTFERCGFSHMAATGLDFVSGTHHDVVVGNTFTDIGGTALQIGFFGDKAFEAHLPYDPSDERTVCGFETISNNYINDVTNEDWGCVGISVGYARDITIDHNEVSNLNYSGICVGWGWTKTINCMRNNKIFANHVHHFAKNMYDVAGIYTLAAQPRSEIWNNSIHDLEKAPYTHDLNHWQYIYFDEGTSGIYVHDNWTEKDKFFTNSNGPGTKWENNGPQVADSIKNAAGLLPEFRDLLK
jgi:hypothetical protein